MMNCLIENLAIFLGLNDFNCIYSDRSSYLVKPLLYNCSEVFHILSFRTLKHTIAIR